MSELSTLELLILFLTPVVVVIGVYVLFRIGAFGPEPAAETERTTTS
jgi:hypothetical protein